MICIESVEIMQITHIERVTSDEYQMNPAGSCKRILPGLDPLLKAMGKRRYNAARDKKAHLRHLTDILEFSIDFRKGTTLYVVGSRHNDSPPCFRTRNSSRDIAHVAKSTCLHQASMDATNCGLIETLHAGN